MMRHEGGYYIRLMARDLPGTAATIAKRLAEQKISIESIVQRAPQSERATAPFILITHDTLESSMRAALEKIERLLAVGDLEDRVAHLALVDGVADEQAAVRVVVHQENAGQVGLSHAPGPEGARRA